MIVIMKNNLKNHKNIVFLNKAEMLFHNIFPLFSAGEQHPGFFILKKYPGNQIGRAHV